MYYLIYKTTNKLNNMIYIGCHKTENKEDGYLGSGTYFKRALEKYGSSNFKKEILFECSTEDEMIKKEEEIVDEVFIARLDTYNITIGGYSGGFYYIKKNKLNHSAGQHLISSIKIKEDEEYRKWFSMKISNGLKLYSENHPYNPNHWVGKKHSEASKKKIGEANSIHQKGSNNSQYGTMWITNGIESKKIKKEEEIPEGWYKGRKLNKFKP